MSIENGLPAGFCPDCYDAIVVGAGYAGAVCARSLAESCGMKVAVLERRDHIGGNAYDYIDDAGVLIHKYGPHIYHTFNDRVDQYLSRFTDWTNYQHKVLANVHGELWPPEFTDRAASAGAYVSACERCPCAFQGGSCGDGAVLRRGSHRRAAAGKVEDAGP